MTEYCSLEYAMPWGMNRPKEGRNTLLSNLYSKLTPRARKALKRLQYDGLDGKFKGSETVADLDGISEDDFQCLRNCGSTTSRELIRALEEAREV